MELEKGGEYVQSTLYGILKVLIKNVKVKKIYFCWIKDIILPSMIDTTKDWKYGKKYWDQDKTGHAYTKSGKTDLK